MKLFTLTCLLCFVLFGFGCQVAPRDITQGQSPNILFILSDDQRYDTMSSMPILRALMAEGTTFSRAYVTTPLCCPSRSSILSGQYAHNHGVLGNRTPYGFPAFDDSETIATRLQDAGYRTGLIGKYLNDYNSQDAQYLPPGWSTFVAFLDKPGYERFRLTSFWDGNYQGIKNINANDRLYSTDYLTDQALAFLRESSANPNQPFFLFFAPFAPHDPATPPDRYASESAPYVTSLSYNEVDVSDKSSYGNALPLLTTTQEHTVARLQQGVHGSLRALDENIGRLLEELQQSGALENTIIFYLSDNGVHWGEHRIVQDKTTPYEEAVHVPFFIYDGRNPQVKTDNRLVLNIDIAPTILQLVGLDGSDQIDGRSLLDDDQWREVFLTEGYGGTDITPFVSVHSTQYVYVHFDNGEEELYDLVNDPYQLHSVDADPLYTAILHELKEALTKLENCSGVECRNI
jgi:arylsulfatase A-like enzyme